MSEAQGATAASPARKTTEPSLVHAEDAKVFLARLDVSVTDGLSEEEAGRRLVEHGENRLPEGKKKSALLRILEQFMNPLVLTLLAAAAIAVVVGVTASSSEGFLTR